MAILEIMANLDGENGENCHMADDSNWMPKVTSWRVAILEITEKMAILAKLAKKFGKNDEKARGLTKSRIWQILKLDAKWPLEIR